MDEMENSLPENGSVAETVTEKMFTQDDLNKIVGREKLKAKAEVEERLKRQFESQPVAQERATPQGDADAIAREVWSKIQAQQEKQMQEEAARREAEEMNRFKQSFDKKLALGKAEYDDFDEVVSKFNGKAYPAVVIAAAELPNTADVMYDLSKKKAKCAELQMMAVCGDYEGLADALTDLSTSIESNKQAKKAPTYNSYQPSPRLKPSGAGSGQRVPTASELDNLDWLRP
jgi:hypothetical protein